MNYLIIAKYTSKYGVILYAAKLREDQLDAPDIDMNNIYINTLYFKGSENLSVGDVYKLQTVKGENGLTYAFR